MYFRTSVSVYCWNGMLKTVCIQQSVGVLNTTHPNSAQYGWRRSIATRPAVIAISQAFGRPRPPHNSHQPPNPWPLWNCARTISFLNWTTVPPPLQIIRYWRQQINLGTKLQYMWCSMVKENCEMPSNLSAITVAIVISLVTSSLVTNTWTFGFQIPHYRKLWPVR